MLFKIILSTSLTKVHINKSHTYNATELLRNYCDVVEINQTEKQSPRLQDQLPHPPR